MGGFGSGGHFRSLCYRHTTKDCLEFQPGYLGIREVINEPDYDKHYSVVEFYKQDNLVFTTKAYIKKYGEDAYLTIGTAKYEAEIYVNMKPTGNGGTRPMMFCPGCGNKKLKLFLKPPNHRSWECLRCHDLTHVSCKESSKPCRMDYFLAASSGIPVRVVRKVFNEMRQCRYEGDYLVETVFKDGKVI